MTLFLQTLMKIFLSHSSRQKPLVREIRNNFPEHIRSWIDEQNLLIGASIESSLSTTIKEDTDFVILFVDSHAVRSGWIQKELEWALEREEKLNRPFILPVLIEPEAWAELQPARFRMRKYV